MQSKEKKIIGIWGYGKVGKSLIQFFIKEGNTVYVMDKNKEVEHELKKDFPAAVFFHELDTVSFEFQEKNFKNGFISPFFTESSLIYPSPGVDIIFYYKKFKEKFKTETDLFFTKWQKPIIAITGSVGKTTVVSFLSSLFHSYGISVATGGNIGTPLLDLLQEAVTTHAVIELSSFQLEYSTSFFPTIAVWTNFYPNHLDRHRTKENYFKAKYQMLIRQTEKEMAIVPTSIIPYFERYGWPKSKLFFVQDEAIYSQPIKHRYPLFIKNNDCVYFIDKYTTKMLLPLDSLPEITIAQNWLTLIATLYVMNLFDDKFTKYAQQIQPIPHRTEFIATINSIAFINDSKSTTVASTLAAVEKYKNNFLILIVGGLSKGVDRTPLFTQLPTHVIHVITFGAEAVALHNICQKYCIPSFSCERLEEAVEKASSIAMQNNIVLFSPAGSSYDLFKNYEERGNFFKKLISNYQTRYTKTDL